MVAAAHLAFDLKFPTELMGSHALHSPNRNIHWIRKLFEKSVAGFYQTVLPKNHWKVKAGKMFNWAIECQTEGIDRILPSMTTDIILDDIIRERRIVIDTKFNSVVTKGQYRKETIRSGYIYQIYAYLRSQEGREDLLANSATGMLLHPSVGEDVLESVVIQGHEIRFATVDLSASTKDIRTRLLQVVGESFNAQESRQSTN